MFRTGDIQKNIEKLRIELHQIKYPDKPDSEILRSGNPEIFLPIIHYTLLTILSMSQIILVRTTITCLPNVI